MLVVTTQYGVTAHQAPTSANATGPSAVVKRTTGFQREWEYVAEATAQTMSGDLVTAREFGHTAAGALARAKAAVASRLTGRRNACGFTADGFRDETRNKATFRVGFAT